MSPTFTAGVYDPADARRGDSRPPFKHSARTRVAFSDTDAQGVVYYGRYNPYFDLARVEYLRRLGLLDRGGDAQFVMRANTVDYLAPAVFDDELEIYCRVARIGRTSMTYECAAYRLPDDLLMVVAELTVVLVDLDERRPIPIPDDVRRQIRGFEGADLDE